MSKQLAPDSGFEQYARTMRRGQFLGGMDRIAPRMVLPVRMRSKARNSH